MKHVAIQQMKIFICYIKDSEYQLGFAEDFVVDQFTVS